jgi:hypothetical protein
MIFLAGFIGAGIAILAGMAVVFGLGKLFPSFKKSTISAVTVTLFVIVGGRVGAWYGETLAASPVATARELLSDAQLGATMTAWRASDRISFESFVASVASRPLGHSTLMEAAREAAEVAAAPRMAYFDDAHAVALANVTRDVYRRLSKQHPQACRAMFHGQPPGNLNAYLGADVIARHDALVSAAFRVDRSVAQPTLTEEEASVVMENVQATVRQHYSDADSLLASTAGDDERFCDVAADMYDTIARLPSQQAGGLLRGLATRARE